MLVALGLSLSIPPTAKSFEPFLNLGEALPLPKEGFKSIAKFKTWAEHSSFTGGYSQEFTLGGRRVFCAKRSVTSGRATTLLSFLVLRDDGRLQPFLDTPLYFREFKITQDEDEIVVRCYDGSAEKWPVALRFSALMLPHDPSDRTRR